MAEGGGKKKKKEWLGKCVSILSVEKQEQERGESIGDGGQVDWSAITSTNDFTKTQILGVPRNTVTWKKKRERQLLACTTTV